MWARQMDNPVSFVGPRPVRDFRIRKASVEDAGGIASVLTTIALERVHSAIERPWPAEQQRKYLESLSAREAFHVATDALGEVVGYQSLDLWSALLSSMMHVGQLGTFILPEWRKRGLGRALFRTSQSFARSSGYHK